MATCKIQWLCNPITKIGMGFANGSSVNHEIVSSLAERELGFLWKDVPGLYVLYFAFCVHGKTNKYYWAWIVYGWILSMYSELIIETEKSWNLFFSWPYCWMGMVEIWCKGRRRLNSKFYSSTMWWGESLIPKIGLRTKFNIWTAI